MGSNGLFSIARSVRNLGYSVPVKTLFLMRHAKSSWANEGLSDHDRPLNKRGLHDAPAMATRLRERGVVFDGVVSSSALRARETVRLFGDVLNWDPGIVHIEPSLYGATAQEWQQLVQQLDEEWNTALMVGHNPTLTEMAQEWGRFDIVNVPTCAWLEIRYAGDFWGNLGDSNRDLEIDFDYPKRLLD